MSVLLSLSTIPQLPIGADFLLYSVSQGATRVSWARRKQFNDASRSQFKRRCCSPTRRRILHTSSAGPSLNGIILNCINIPHRGKDISILNPIWNLDWMELPISYLLNPNSITTLFSSRRQALGSGRQLSKRITILLLFLLTPILTILCYFLTFRTIFLQHLLLYHLTIHLS